MDTRMKTKIEFPVAVAIAVKACDAALAVLTPDTLWTNLKFPKLLLVLKPTVAASHWFEAIVKVGLTADVV
jgi:hypothetical protein